MADNNAIGRNGDMPWHLSEDLKYFKRVTSGYPVIMGRKTYESIGRPLPKRRNIVITRGNSTPEGTIHARSLEEAFSIASACFLSSGAETSSDDTRPERCFVIGGGQIYTDAVNVADKLYITHIHTIVDDADTFFPAIDMAVWEEDSRSETVTDKASGLCFEFAVYRRK